LFYQFCCLKTKVLRVVLESEKGACEQVRAREGRDRHAEGHIDEVLEAAPEVDRFEGAKCRSPFDLLGFVDHELDVKGKNSMFMSRSNSARVTPGSSTSPFTLHQMLAERFTKKACASTTSLPLQTNFRTTSCGPRKRMVKRSLRSIQDLTLLVSPSIVKKLWRFCQLGGTDVRSHDERRPRTSCSEELWLKFVSKNLLRLQIRVATKCLLAFQRVGRRGGRHDYLWWELKYEWFCTLETTCHIPTCPWIVRQDF